METVYVETTIPSYLAAWPSRDLIAAAHQQITHEWWLTARLRYDLYVSANVMIEIRAGDATAAVRRLEIVSGLPILEMNDDVRELLRVYDKRLGMEGGGLADLPHFAFAVVYEMDYLLSWNCTHIVNGHIIRRLNNVNAELNLKTPVVVTPEELLVPPPFEELR